MQSYPIIPITSIDRSDRGRKEYKNIEELAESIKSIGIIQPVVLNQVLVECPFEAGTLISEYTLAAGGRRMAALDLLGIKELHHAVTCDPIRIGYVLANELSEADLLAVELEENLQRMNMTWIEDTLLLDKTHRAKVREAALGQTTWGQRQTGALLGVSAGHVHNITAIAKRLTSGEAKFLACTSVTEAIKLLLDEREDLANAELAKHSVIGIESPKLRKSTTPSLQSGTLDDLKFDLTVSFGDDSSPTELPQSRSIIEQDSSPIAGIETIQIPLSSMFRLGNSVRDIMPSMANESIDHIVCDPPYGVDAKNMENTVGDFHRVEETHQVDENIALLEAFLPQAFRIMKDCRYLVMWYDLDHHEKISGWAKKAGFKVQRWPIIWHKTHQCRNQAPQYNFTKNVEYAMVLRKGNATLLNPQISCVIAADGKVERDLYKNPFAKPFAVWKFIFDAIALKGQRVDDFFMGEGSSCRAAIMCGLRPHGVELDPAHYNRAIEHFRTSYNLLTRNKAEFI